MAVRTKTVYEKAGPGDGRRVLVMRFWPRGVRKESVNGWEKELGTPADLIKDWKAGRVTWQEFSRRYRTAVASQKERIAQLTAAATEGTVTLLCSCRDEGRCHRSILKRLIEAAQRGTRKGRAVRRTGGGR